VARADAALGLHERAAGTRYARYVGFRVSASKDWEWVTRPHDPGEPARHVAELSDQIGLASSRANVWRYEPGARGVRHRHTSQEETFVVLSGTLTMYLGEPPARHDVSAGGIIHVQPGTALQSVNHADEDLLVYVHGAPPENERAEILPSAL
jgi:quercetin dioxygenase-like cupin family protein